MDLGASISQVKQRCLNSHVVGDLPSCDVSGFCTISWFLSSNEFSFKLAESLFFTLYENSTESLIAQNGVQKSFVILNRNMDFILCLLLNKSFLNIFWRADGT